MSKKGFSLTELIVVIGVLGLIATIATVSVVNLMGKSQEKLKTQQINELKDAAATYALDEELYIKRCENDNFSTCEYEVIHVSDLIPSFFENKGKNCKEDGVIKIYMNKQYDYHIIVDDDICTK